MTDNEMIQDHLKERCSELAIDINNFITKYNNFIKETKESNFSDEEINKFLESNEWIELEKAMNELEEAAL